MQFLVRAYDGKDMLQKRMSVRGKHLENIETFNEKGHIICAGGILDSKGNPIGSALILEFDSRDQLDEYLSTEPYLIEKVWENVIIEVMNVVIN